MHGGLAENDVKWYIVVIGNPDMPPLVVGEKV